MLELGKRQKLKIVKSVNFGVYLGEAADAQERVLLPAKEVPEGAAAGDELEVFLYKDSKDRLIATVREPLVKLGDAAVLTVKEVGNIGAFLDWGLEKDLLLPFKEQTRRVRQGEKCLAAVYIDKSSRLCATMNVYEYLQKDSPYKKEDKVTGVVYLISVREKAYIQIDEDAENVMKVIEEFEGVLPFNDKVSPDVIMREFGLSKAAFKRAVGRLLKNGRIEITENRIKKVK